MGKPKHSATSVTAEAEIYLPLENLISIDRERERIERQVGAFTAELQKINRKLANRDFLAKAPKEVVEAVREKKEEFEEKLARFTKNLAMLED